MLQLSLFLTVSMLSISERRAVAGNDSVQRYTLLVRCHYYLSIDGSAPSILPKYLTCGLSGVTSAPSEERRFTREFISYNLTVSTIRALNTQPMPLVDSTNLQSRSAGEGCGALMLKKARGRQERTHRVAREPRARHTA